MLKVTALRSWKSLELPGRPYGVTPQKTRVRSYTAEKTSKLAFTKVLLLSLKISLNSIFMKAPNEDLQLVAGANSVVLPAFQTLFIEMRLSEGTVRATVSYGVVCVVCGPAALCMHQVNA